VEEREKTVLVEIGPERLLRCWLLPSTWQIWQFADGAPTARKIPLKYHRADHFDKDKHFEPA